MLKDSLGWMVQEALSEKAREDLLEDGEKPTRASLGI
jgi:hypothetical protein